MDRRNALRAFVALFLICITAGAVIQNIQLRERVIKLEPRVTQIEKIARVTQVNRTVVRTIKINRRPVIKREFINISVAGLKGDRGRTGRRGPKGSRGSKGSRGPQGPQGTPGPIDKIIEKQIDGLQNLVVGLQGELTVLRTQINYLLCILLKCPK